MADLTSKSCRSASGIVQIGRHLEMLLFVQPCVALRRVRFALASSQTLAFVLRTVRFCFRSFAKKNDFTIVDFQKAMLSDQRPAQYWPAYRNSSRVALIVRSRLVLDPFACEGFGHLAVE
jgi:hypothetical protein